MKRFKSILVVYEGLQDSQSALAKAIDLATQNKARLTVIQVINEIPRNYRMLFTAPPSQEILAGAVKEQKRLLEKDIVHFPEVAGMQIKVVAGQKFIEIIKEVIGNSHDLVIKTALGMGGTIDMLFDSTAMHLLRKCPCPVWLIKPEQGLPYRRIMAAVDVVPSEVGDNILNNKIVELATSLTRMEKSELHIVHAREKLDANLWTGGLNFFSTEVNTLINESKDMHIRWLDDFLGQQDLQNLQHHRHILEGWTDEVIPAFAEQHQIDLIVMGSVCRTGIPGFFIGNTAEKILHKINCSVLAVKPDGFISPVQVLS